MAELAFGEKFDRDFTWSDSLAAGNNFNKSYKLHLHDELIETCRKKEWMNVCKKIGLYKDLMELIWFKSLKQKCITTPFTAF